MAVWRFIALGLVAGAALALAAGPPGDRVQAGPTPPVQITDGDSLTLNGVRMRLIGIDAPEIGQTCGRADGTRWACGTAARAALAALLSEDPGLICTGDQQDRYHRLLVRCHGRFGDLGQAMVTQGLAWAYRRYASDHAAAELRAQRRGVGIWQGDSQTPETFRRAKAAAAAVPVPDHCRIKGNISGNGRMYHLPGQRFYGRTHVAVGRGERWFCSEAEAVAAGWRKARS